MYLLPSRFVLTLALSAALTPVLGCSSALISTPITSQAIPVTGNWQLAAAAQPKLQLPMLSGELSGTSAAMTGILHSQGSSACIASDQAVAVTGSTDKNGLVTLGGSLAGGTLTVTGTLAPDGRSLTNASYSVRGGTCAFAAVPLLSAQAYSPITGNYTGVFSDSAGPVLSISASLTQTPGSDTSGNFQLSGTATFPANGCFNSPVSVASSQVTGGSFDLTYADSGTGNSVEALGTFSPDGKTLTVTQWTLAGSCGPDSGTGSLTRP